MQLSLEESKQLAGGGKERRKGGNAGRVLLTSPTSSSLEFWAGDQPSCLTLIPGQEPTTEPFTPEPNAGASAQLAVLAPRSLHPHIL